MIDTLLRLLFPETCYKCKKAGTALCTDCYATIPTVKKALNSAHIFSFYDYDDRTVRQAVWNLKYRRNSSLAKMLVSHYTPTLAPETSFLKIVLVPMPQHYTKTLSRGFNQSALLAQWMRNLVPGSIVVPLLKKIRSTIPQVRTQNIRQRGRNLQYSMVADSVAVTPETIYVIVDDVITTGSTAKEASRALRAAGAQHIQVVALAHGSAR